MRKHQRGSVETTRISARPSIAKTIRTEPGDTYQPMLLWHKFALGTVLAISTFFDFFALAKQDFFEYYYAAAIKSMLINWHALFFVSFDSSGFVGVSKPPLGLWIQVLSVKLFGYSAFSILLPEALSGVLAVALVFHLVHRVFGPLAGLIAALVLAISPISVATNRNNIVDSLLVLTVLLAAWMVSKAAESGRLRWLCLCAVLVGLGFNIKFLQAYMVVPAFGLVYWLGAPVRKRTKFCHLVLALGVLLLVSLCWVTIFDLTPASQRPYVDATTNSELGLALGYNVTFLASDSAIVNTWAWEIGKPGIMRFFEQPVAGQCSWLLPLALFSLLGLKGRKRWHLPLNRRQQALVLWGTWLSTMLVIFSNGHFFHLYYLSMLSPAIAALVGVGVVTLWQDYIGRGWRGWLLPCALLVTGIFQVYLLAPFSQWSYLLTVSIVGCCISVTLVSYYRFLHLEAERQCTNSHKATRIKRYKEQSIPAHQHTFNRSRVIVLKPHLQRFAALITTLGLVSLSLAPTVWAAIPLSQAGRAFPIGGPLMPQAHIPPLIADPMLVHYLLVHKSKEQILLATMNTEAAAPFILDTGQAVLALGGYDGSRNFLTRDQLIQKINHGMVRFFLLPSMSDQAGMWVITHCGTVPTDQWQSPSTNLFSVDELQLYDCAHHT